MNFDKGDAALVAWAASGVSNSLLEKIMRISFVIGAEFRDTQGKGASRRLRRTGKVPAILYGGSRPAQPWSSISRSC